MTLRLRQARVTDIPLIYRGEQDYIRCREPDHEAQWRLQLERHLSCGLVRSPPIAADSTDAQK
jgi:hypothetical protein